MTTDTVWAVVPAAGIGVRMQGDRPKQYLTLHGKTVLEHTLNRLIDHPRIAGIVVAIAEHDAWWQHLKLVHAAIYTVTGGAQRAQSVLNALNKLQVLTSDDPWVLVHDAVRPCLRHCDIDLMIDSLHGHPVGGVLGMLINDTIKRTNDQRVITDTLDRQGLWRAATPQMFHLHALIRALHVARDQQITVTDEASAMAIIGLQAVMVAGHTDNIKITLPQDLTLAALFLQHQQETSK